MSTVLRVGWRRGYAGFTSSCIQEHMQGYRGFHTSNNSLMFLRGIKIWMLAPVTWCENQGLTMNIFIICGNSFSFWIEKFVFSRIITRMCWRQEYNCHWKQSNSEGFCVQWPWMHKYMGLLHEVVLHPVRCVCRLYMLWPLIVRPPLKHMSGLELRLAVFLWAWVQSVTSNSWEKQAKRMWSSM